MSDAQPDNSPMNDTRRRRVALAIVVCYWLLWLTMTHWPKLELPPLSRFRVDKFVHFFGYCLLALLLSLLRLTFFPDSRLPRFWGAATILLIIAAGGIFDELTQPYFGRSFEWGDYAADLLGAVLGLAIAAWYVSHRSARQDARST